jgi:hypothetical protein
MFLSLFLSHTNSWLSARMIERTNTGAWRPIIFFSFFSFSFSFSYLILVLVNTHNCRKATQYPINQSNRLVISNKRPNF